MTFGWLFPFFSFAYSIFLFSFLLHGVGKASVIGFGIDGLIMILVFWPIGRDSVGVSALQLLDQVLVD